MRRVSVLSFGPTLAMIVLNTAAPAELDVEIAWTAPSQCPTEAWLKGRVERFLDRPIREAVVEPVDAFVEVTELDGRFQAVVTLTTGGRAQTRTLADEQCEVLAAATAFIIAVAIDPDVVFADESEEDLATGETAPEPSTGKPTESPADGLEDTVTAVEPEPGRAPSQLRGAVRVHGTGALGVLPGFAVGLGAAGALHLGRARLELLGGWHFERETELGNGRNAAVRLWELGARGCFAPEAGPVEFPLCAGAQAGVMRGRSRGVSVPGEASQAWAAARAGAGVSYVPSRYAGITLGAEALIPLVRPRFVVENLGEVFEPAPVGLLLQLGVEARFP